MKRATFSTRVFRCLVACLMIVIAGGLFPGGGNALAQPSGSTGVSLSGAATGEGAAPTRTFPAGLVSFWNFDESSGSVAYDPVNGNNGTVTGATPTDGVAGKALSFDGVNDYVLVPHSSPLAFSGNGAIEFWMKQSGDIGTLMWKRFYAGSLGWTLYLGFPNTLIGYVNDDATFVQATVSSGQWQHVALIYDGAMKLYVNGILARSVSE